MKPLSRRLTWYRWILIVYGAVAVVLLLGPATYLIAYESSAYGAKDDACQGEDGYETFGTSGGSQGDEDPDGSQQNAASKVGLSARQLPDAPIRIACQANAVMRTALHVQVLTFVIGLIPALLSMVGVVVAIWELARREDEVMKDGVVLNALPELEVVSTVERKNRHHGGLSDGNVDGRWGISVVSSASMMMIR